MLVLRVRQGIQGWRPDQAGINEQRVAVIFLQTTADGDGFLKIRIPDDFRAGKYRLVLGRGETQYPLGSSEFNVVSDLKNLYNTKIVAHRGYHYGNAAENSVASLAEAQKLGVYGSEFDVYITTDGVPVIYHNSTFKGDEVPEDAKYKGWRPDSRTYEEIKDYKLANGEPLPTLDDYLNQAKLYPNVKLIIEIKNHNTTIRQDYEGGADLRGRSQGERIAESG